MQIPTHKKDCGIDIFNTMDYELVHYLETLNILPINEFNNVASFIKCTTLEEAIKKYDSGGTKKNG